MKIYREVRQKSSATSQSSNDAAEHCAQLAEAWALERGARQLGDARLIQWAGAVKSVALALQRGERVPAGELGELLAFIETAESHEIEGEAGAVVYA